MKNLKTGTKYFKLCSNCNFFCSTNESDEYCSLCGSKLVEECPKCGKKISNPYARFCKFCGAVYPGKNSLKNNGEDF